MKRDDWQLVCDCLKRRCWESSGAAGQLGLIEEGKEKAAVCWHLVTATHYCTDAMKYELDCLRVPIQRHCTPCIVLTQRWLEEGPTLSVFSVLFRGLQSRGGTGGFNWDTAYVCRSENSREVSRTDCQSCLRREACRDSSSPALSTFPTVSHASYMLAH